MFPLRERDSSLFSTFIHIKNNFTERCYFIDRIIIEATIILNIHIELFYKAAFKYGSVL